MIFGRLMSIMYAATFIESLGLFIKILTFFLKLPYLELLKFKVISPELTEIFYPNFLYFLNILTTVK